MCSASPSPAVWKEHASCRHRSRAEYGVAARYPAGRHTVGATPAGPTARHGSMALRGRGGRGSAAAFMDGSETMPQISCATATPRRLAASDSAVKSIAVPGWDRAGRPRAPPGNRAHRLERAPLGATMAAASRSGSGAFRAALSDGCSTMLRQVRCGQTAQQRARRVLLSVRGIWVKGQPIINPGQRQP